MGGVGISLTLLLRSCGIGGFGLEKEGRCDWETELSARDLICSDQLKPASAERAETEKSDAVLGFECVLACACA